MERHVSSNSANPQQQEQPQGQLLPTALQLHILLYLPQNDRALSGRFACRDAADALSGPQHCTASLSQPLPPHAAPWAQEAGQQHVRQLPFRHKFQLLSTAARSGSEVNLEVAWALLEPSVFPELLQNEPDSRNRFPDPGAAAVRAGHIQLLSWLLQCCPRLLQPGKVLEAAALHRPLAELHQVWDTLRGHTNSGSGDSSKSSSNNGGCSHGRRVHLTQAVLDAAAQSHTPDAVAKMEWLLVAGADSCRLQVSTARFAACSGDLGRLRWLRDRGCPVVNSALYEALEHASPSVAQWLVGEGLCELPLRAGEGAGSGYWDGFLYAAAKSQDGVAKLLWLQEQGAPLFTGDGEQLVKDLALVAVEAGRVEVVQYLLSAVGPAAVIRGQDRFGEAAVKSRSTQTAEYLVHEAGLVLSHKAYNWAAKVGGLAMVRWLALEAGVSAAGCNLSSVVEQWPRGTQADSRALLEAVQLVLGAGCWETHAEQDPMAVAARRGDLALVQYLHQRPLGQLPVGQYQAAAVSGGCEALLEWMAQQPGWCDNADSPYRYAASSGDRGSLAALRRLGVPWGIPNVLPLAVSEWRCEVPVLRWLAEQGAPMGHRRKLQRAVKAAIESGFVTMEVGRQLSRWAAGGGKSWRL